MKNLIMFYYNFDEFDLLKKSNIYYFRYQNDLYSFEIIENVEQLKNIIYIINLLALNRYFQLVPNIYRQFFTEYQGQLYALFLRNRLTCSVVNELLHLPLVPKDFLEQSHIEISVINWDVLWSKKVDYYEYQVQHISNIYPLITESFNYFIGMTETAISYIRYNFSYKETNFYLCHKRLNVDDYFHPKNLVIDYYPRDVAEYFKYLFFSNNYHNFPFLTFLRQLHFSYDDFILLFARLIYPSYYFDCYDEIINSQAREEQLKSILLRTKEYIIFLANIYNIICQITPIPSVWWIKKETL